MKNRAHKSTRQNSFHNVPATCMRRDSSIRTRKMTISELSQLIKLVKALLDLIEEDPDVEVIERYPYSPDADEPSKGGAA